MSEYGEPPLFQATRHFPPTSSPWNERVAREAIQEIARDAFAALDPSALWPGHPMDDGQPDQAGNLYFGAAGVIWALDYLAEAEVISSRQALGALIPIAIERNARWFASGPYPNQASLLMGELGIRLVQMRLAPTRSLADMIHGLAAANNDLPVLELMWGLPGSMLACLHVFAMTGESRFKTLFQCQSKRLLAELETTDDGPIWTQELYGSRKRYFGPVHGFAGNALPLIQGWDWLEPEQQAVLADGLPQTLAAHAVRSSLGVNWPAVASSGRPLVLCQHCHGAPGMVATFANAPFSTPQLEGLLLAGGELTWNAGALAKGSNLCHGTGGNGYALLKLYERTGNTLWLDRARSFAATAITQVRGARAAFGRGRYSLWTGDVGLAVYLWDCITARPRFPTVDVL